jgi:uncharacterized protein
MIVYKATKTRFMQDVLENQIEKEIGASFVREVGHRASPGMVESWRNSMQYMERIVADPEIPEDVGIAIEYKIPQTGKLIDFIITGLDDDQQDSAVIVELKQWSHAEMTDMDGVVSTFVGGRVGNHEHPSYQAWSYVRLLEDFNASIEEEHIGLHPCAYLHNYEKDDVITNDFYKKYWDEAPVFLRNDAMKLRQFVKRFIKHGDKNDVLYKIENGRIRPSKQLADSLSSMLKGNQEFILIDEQKVVYETALKLAREATDEVKNVLIVEGGPGTGKSVVAINLLVELIKRGQLAQYVTRNSAPRKVYEAKLTGSMSLSRFSNLFTPSGSFIDVDPNSFDCLIVDEAHRLNAKSGLYSNLGENQIKELISAAKCSIFFVDEDQRVTMADIGHKDEIRLWAESMGAQITELELSSQFRCNGSDGYLAWLDNTLGIRETANETLDDINYDFQVVKSAEKLKEMIVAKNGNNKARMVADYCWKWRSAKDPTAYDIEIGDFKAQWNLKSYGQVWIIKPGSVEEVGCIHTCQGLEVDYIGVIIGPDLVVRNGQVITDASKRAPSDKSIRGYKKLLKENPDQAQALADTLIKNTYRTLMTRGMKGCYVYSTDRETREYFAQLLKQNQ